MTTIYLATLVVLINLFTYSSNYPQGYEIVMHIYYGIMILAGKYSGRVRASGACCALTTIANWLYIVLYYDQMYVAVVTTVVATVYPLIALFIARTLRSSALQRDTNVEELQNLGSRVRDLATLFEVGKAANAALELDELFQEIMKILANRMGVYRGTLRIWQDGKRTRTMGAVFGLTKAETPSRHRQPNSRDSAESSGFRTGDWRPAYAQTASATRPSRCNFGSVQRFNCFLVYPGYR